MINGKSFLIGFGTGLAVGVLLGSFVFYYLNPSLKSDKVITNLLTSPSQSQSITSSLTSLDAQNLEILAWMYPGEPACKAFEELEAGLKPSILKAEYFTVNSEGELQFLTEEDAGCNGYSESNIQKLKQFSKQQYLTVSGQESIVKLVTNEEFSQKAIEQLVDFVEKNNFAGVEIDFEAFSSWGKDGYAGYIKFLQGLGDKLRSVNKKLMVATPPIYSESIAAAYADWDYKDFENLPVDYISLMAYDYQYDHGGGQPVAPDQFINDSIDWILKNISNKNRLVVGLPTYGYTGTENSYDEFRLITYDQTQKIPQINQAVRDPNSQEMILRQGGKVTVFQDDQSIKHKIELVQKKGISKISIWHLGGNIWFK